MGNDAFRRNSEKFSNLKKYCPDSEILARIMTYEKQKQPDTGTRIESCNFSRRLYNCLIRSGICTVEQLLDSTWEQITKIRNLGAVSMEELSHYLKDRNLTLNGKTAPEWLREKELSNKKLKPVYSHSLEYAREHYELSDYHASYKENLSCETAINDAINANYKNNRLDTDNVIKEVLDKFDRDRVIVLVVNTILAKQFDGRISRDNKEWAKNIPMPEDRETNSHWISLLIDEVNPGLLDLFATSLRKMIE